MNTHKQQGFTVIEVVLFLAISGLVGVGILATAASSVNQERYRDSVRTFHAHLQEQYSNVVNTRNDRSGDRFRCVENGSIVDTTEGSGGTTQSRGASECFIVGRVVDVLDSGHAVISSQPVYATYDPMKDATLPASDVQAFDRSQLVLAPASSSAAELGRTETDMEWGTSIVATSGNPTKFRLLILRSPFSGMIRTYAESGTNLPATSTSTVRALIGRENDVTACVNPVGLFTGQTLGVKIARGASSSSGVVLLDGGVC